MKNWKTTLIGIGVGALQLWAGGASLENIVTAAGIAALGAFSKDFNVTGGTSKVGL